MTEERKEKIKVMAKERGGRGGENDEIGEGEVRDDSQTINPPKSTRVSIPFQPNLDIISFIIIIVFIHRPPTPI